MEKISKFFSQNQHRNKRKTKRKLEVADLGNRDDIKVKVFSRLRKHEQKLFRAATALKWPLCFGAPVAAIAFVLLILVCIYNVGPYNAAKRFIETQCTVTRIITMGNKTGSCRYRRAPIMPCSEIWVKYKVPDTGKQLQSLLMEDELANCRCVKCSYTNGLGHLFSTVDSCAWNGDYSLQECMFQYLLMFQKLGNSSFTCYFDPETEEDVIYKKEITAGQMAYQLGLPIIYLVIFLAGLGIVIYAYVRRRSIIKELLYEEEQKQNLNGQAKVLGSTTESPDLDHALSSNVIKRTRKKKLPCCRPHNFFDLEEAIVLEQKPISQSQGDQASSSMNIELQPFCSDHQNTSIGAWGFERINQTEDELRPVMAVYEGTQPSGSRLFRYLPESVV